MPMRHAGDDVWVEIRNATVKSKCLVEMLRQSLRLPLQSQLSSLFSNTTNVFASSNAPPYVTSMALEGCDDN